MGTLLQRCRVMVLAGKAERGGHSLWARFLWRRGNWGIALVWQEKKGGNP